MEVTLVPTDELKKMQADIAALRQNTDDWIEDKVATQLLGVHTKTLYRLRRNGLLPYSKTGRKVYYRKKDLADYLMRYYNDLVENYTWNAQKTKNTENND